MTGMDRKATESGNLRVALIEGEWGEEVAPFIPSGRGAVFHEGPLEPPGPEALGRAGGMTRNPGLAR